MNSLPPIKACPFCGSMSLTYMDPDIPVYAYCPTCKTWVSGGRDYDVREVRYIIDKLKMMHKAMEDVYNEREYYTDKDGRQ